MSITCSAFSIYICKTISTHGYEAYIVGGFVRDALLDRESGDIDITTSASPDTIESLFKHTIPTGKLFGTITVLSDDKSEAIEVTTFRSESGYSNSRHPDSIVYGCSLTEDLSRRDFTINAMAYDCQTEQLTDVFHGKDDLNSKQIRTVGNATQRFTEDSLRLFRACRFSSQLGFDIERSTRQSIINLGASIPLPSMERVHSELNLIMMSSFPERGLVLLNEAKLLSRLGIETNLDLLYELSGLEVDVRWATYFESLELVSEKMKLLRFSNSDINHVKRLIENDLDPIKANFTVKDLAISGKELQEMGFKGAQIGVVQRHLKKEVLEHGLENTKTVLNGAGVLYLSQNFN
jgi:tRNA nucleotidyltransferase (CCA-adding enzyme)